jgi:hypothetical protein
MRLKWLSGLALTLLVLALPAAARAGDKPAADEPTVVIRIQSIDTVFKNIKLLASLAGREEAGAQIEALIKAKAGKKGIEGVDPTRPLGAYVRFGKELEDLGGAILVPIADEKAFITLLENLNLQPSKGKDDIYTVQAKNVALYVRFANRYAYVSGVNIDNLSDKKLLDPAKVLGGKEGVALSVGVRLDQVPAAAKLLAVQTFRQNLEDAQQKTPTNETVAQKALRLAASRQLLQSVENVLKDGQKVTLSLDINEQSKDFVVEFSLSGQSGTELARTLQKLGQSPSLFAGNLRKDAAVQGLAHAALPKPLRDEFLKVLDEGAKKGLDDIQDEAKRAQAQQLFDALRPTFAQAELDAFIGFTGPVGKFYTALAAVKVQDGDKLGATVHDLIADALKTMPAEQKDKVHLDEASVGAVKVHRFELPRDAKNEKAFDEVLGDNNLYVAFRKDAVFFAIGKEGLSTLKDAVSSMQGKAGPVLRFDFDVPRMVRIIAKTPAQRELAQKLFKSGDDGVIRFTITGGPALTARLTMRLNTLEFFAKAKDKGE